MCGPFNFLENQARSPRRSHTIFGLVCHQQPPLLLRSPPPFDVLSAPTFPFLHIWPPRATPWAPQAGASPLPATPSGFSCPGTISRPAGTVPSNPESPAPPNRPHGGTIC